MHANLVAWASRPRLAIGIARGEVGRLGVLCYDSFYNAKTPEVSHLKDSPALAPRCCGQAPPTWGCPRNVTISASHWSLCSRTATCAREQITSARRVSLAR
ncbi:hypothetical protein HaLaN_29392 [Haematococcus lacustris]|uniref:Uncharacterized protein n=1 Tax=Haematococcus lacustris TaxID=44745 RepID=A0A6A0ACD2_HAELA|nr:hypothetical protein HaLaN_29392 [Haematococcus lacustris]